MVSEQNEQEETIEIPEPIQPSIFTEAEAQAIEIPEPVQPPVEETAEVEHQPVYEQPIIPFSPPPTPVEPEPEKDELADLFEVPQPEDNDMVIDHLLSTEDIGEDDLSDLVEVEASDIMGDDDDFPGTPPPQELPERVRPVKRFKRTPRRYLPPPTSLGGVRY